MIRYATYHPTTGQIMQWGEVQAVPEGTPHVVHEILGPLTDYYVDVVQRKVVPKPRMTLTYPSGATPADGETEAVIDGLPVGTVCEFMLDGDLHRMPITDGNLEVALPDPATIRVTFWHPTYWHDPVELRFV